MKIQTLTTGLAALCVLGLAAYAFLPRGEKPLIPPSASEAVDAKPKATPSLPPLPPLEMPASIKNLPQSDGMTDAEKAALMKLDLEADEEIESLETLLTPLRAWAAKNPEECLEWASKNLKGAVRQRAMEEAVALWSAKSPEAALDWLNQQPKDDTLDGAYAAALANFAGQNATGAIDWLKNNPDHAGLSNWENVLSSCGAHYPLEASRWTATQLDPSMRDSMLATMLTTFRQPDATTELLRNVPADTADASLSNAAKAATNADPAFALSLAQRIQNQETRQATINETLRHWLEVNPNAARAYATQHQLTLPPTDSTQPRAQ